MMADLIAQAIIWPLCCFVVWGLWKYADDLSDGNIERMDK